MRVAFFVYPSAFQNKGGGEILLEKIEEYLVKNGIDVKRFDTWYDKIEDFDILHVFGSVKECLPLMRVARSRKVKVVLESIFWSDFRRAFFEEGTVLKKTEMILRHTMKVVVPFFPSSRKNMFDTADIIFPNSKNEALQISKLFNIPMKKMFVVPNGVDSSFSEAKPDLFIKEYGLKDFVLSVGRIEPRKNQLSLIKAMTGIDRDLVLVGDTVSGYEWYRDECEKLGGKRVHFINKLEHASYMLASAYAACEVFVLPGWFETPGLAALEAALAGAKIVATDGGSTREYFLDKVFYLKPNDFADIRDNIKKALEIPYTGTLKDFVFESYVWDRVIKKNIHCYEKTR